VSTVLLNEYMDMDMDIAVTFDFNQMHVNRFRFRLVYYTTILEFLKCRYVTALHLYQKCHLIEDGVTCHVKNIDSDVSFFGQYAENKNKYIHLGWNLFRKTG